MVCPQCEVWEVLASDNRCSWCGLSFLSFTVAADRSTVSAGEYPPPVELTVSNLSASREIDVEGITSSVPWISPLSPGAIPQRIGAAQQRRFLVEVDTIAAPQGRQGGEVRVDVAYAGSRSITLEIV